MLKNEEDIPLMFNEYIKKYGSYINASDMTLLINFYIRFYGGSVKESTSVVKQIHASYLSQHSAFSVFKIYDGNDKTVLAIIKLEKIGATESQINEWEEEREQVFEEGGDVALRRWKRRIYLKEALPLLLRKIERDMHHLNALFTKGN
jgi:hypothetical protein